MNRAIAAKKPRIRIHETARSKRVRSEFVEGFEGVDGLRGIGRAHGFANRTREGCRVPWCPSDNPGDGDRVLLPVKAEIDDSFSAIGREIGSRNVPHNACEGIRGGPLGSELYRFGRAYELLSTGWVRLDAPRPELRLLRRRN